MIRKLLVTLFIIAGAALANETSFRTLQSGSQFGTTPIHDHGIHGENQIIAILDTGLDINSCFFVEIDGSMPPFNTGSPNGGLDWQNGFAGRFG